MKIAVCAPFEERVPPVKYGGTELVVYNLVETLVALGHDVTLLATGDSLVSAKLLPVFEKALRTYPEMQDMKMRDAYKYIAFGKVLEYLRKDKFDIVHSHLGWRLLPFESLIEAPVVTTLHGPLDSSYQQVVYKKFKDSKYISISNNQRVPLPELNFVGTVYNGIDVAKFDFFEQPQDYFAFLGRMSPEKGPVQAIEAVKKAGVKLVMAGKVDTVDKEFFKKEVEPLIDGKQIKFIGEIGHDEKVRFLKKAKALIAPIQWREPFGLFFIEAMACGAPVIAYPYGSVSEVIEDKKTGFIVKDIEEMVEAIKNIDKINRRKCRERVEKYFTVEKMVDEYEKIYHQIVACQGL